MRANPPRNERFGPWRPICGDLRTIRYGRDVIVSCGVHFEGGLCRSHRLRGRVVRRRAHLMMRSRFRTGRRGIAKGAIARFGGYDGRRRRDTARPRLPGIGSVPVGRAKAFAVAVARASAPRGNRIPILSPPVRRDAWAAASRGFRLGAADRPAPNRRPAPEHRHEEGHPCGLRLPDRQDRIHRLVLPPSVRPWRQGMPTDGRARRRTIGGGAFPPRRRPVSAPPDFAGRRLPPAG